LRMVTLRNGPKTLLISFMKKAGLPRKLEIN
jgi:hypothetical protein